MKHATFRFGNMNGWVDTSGFMSWGGIHCTKSAAIGNLRKAVEKAFATL